jgi:hypothetical protein
MPVLDLAKVDYNKTVQKEHTSIILESEFLRVVILPEMGRVYSMLYKPTNHETLWRNDIAWPGGANNRLGWWLWIGGIEYTLPGEEHGYTWALPWKFSVNNSSASSKSVSCTVVEPTTGLHEQLEFTLSAGSAALQTDVSIYNPGAPLTHSPHYCIQTHTVFLETPAFVISQ